MRTTLDIPDDLLRRAKAEAALKGKTLQAFVMELLEQKLGLPQPPSRRVRLPLVRSMAPGRLRLSGADVAEAMAHDDRDVPA